MAGLHPGGPGRPVEQVVEGLDRARWAQAAQAGAARVGDAGKGADRAAGGAPASPGRGRWSSCRPVEPDRVGVVGVGEAERRRVAVHLGDEAGFRAGGGERQVVGGVVAAAQDQAVEQVAHADPLRRDAVPAATRRRSRHRARPARCGRAAARASPRRRSSAWSCWRSAGCAGPAWETSTSPLRASISAQARASTGGPLAAAAGRGTGSSASSASARQARRRRGAASP